VNVGCIPKKLLVYASHYGTDFGDAAAYGWDLGPRTFDWARLIANKDKEIARLNGIYGNILQTNGVEILNGTARVLDPHTIEIGGRRVENGCDLLFRTEINSGLDRYKHHREHDADDRYDKAQPVMEQVAVGELHDHWDGPPSRPRPFADGGRFGGSVEGHVHDVFLSVDASSM
jgi:hypothetical protein